MRTNAHRVRTPGSRAGTALAGLVAVGLFATGCTGSSGGTRGGQATSFTFGIGAAPISLDIAKDFDGNIMQIMALVTEKLELISSNGDLSPALATSVTQPDSTTLVYHIRSGVTFSDGTPLTAQDVAWSLQHMTDVKAGAQTAGNVPSFQSAAASGPLQVTVKLKRLDPTARQNLAVISFVQEAKFGAAHQKDLGTAAAIPIGTGPYQVSSDTTQAVSLTRNPHYWGPKPPMSKISFNVITGGDNTSQLAMRSGSIQGTLVANLKTASQWQAVKGASLYTLPALTTTFLTLDISSGPLSDVHVRKAIAYSIDRAGVMAAGYGKYASLMRGLAPAGVLADVAPSVQEAEAFLAALPQYDLDPAKARSELAQSAYPHGFSLTIPYVQDAPFSQLTVENLAQNVKPLGVTIKLKAITTQQWIATIYAHGKGLGVQTMELIPPVPDPGAVLGVVTGKPNIRPQGFNLANWSTPQVEQAFTQLTTSVDKQTRWRAAQTLLTAIADDVPYIPLYDPDTVAVLGNGFSFSRALTLFDLDVNGTWASALKTG